MKHWMTVLMDLAEFLLVLAMLIAAFAGLSFIVGFMVYQLIKWIFPR